MLIPLKVKPYTAKFLAKHIGTSYKLRLDDPFGIHLFGLLKANNQCSRADAFLGKYTCIFPIQVDKARLDKKGARGLTGHTIINFNNFAELVFKHEFHTFVETWTAELNLSVAEAIRRFCTRYGLLEDDISEDSLRRSYLRYQGREKSLADKPQATA